jgi:hypothetical protein
MVRKAFEPDDPMELRGVAFPGSALEEMAECMIEEYIKMGYDEEAILRFFQHPFYQATHLIYRERGEVYVKALIQRIKEKWGLWRFSVRREK